MNGLPVHRAKEALHLALPAPSIWPLLLSAALCALMVGLLLIDKAPWLVLIAVFFVFVGILGLALEDREPGPIDQHETLILPTMVQQVIARADAQLWTSYSSDTLPPVDQRETLVLPRAVEQVSAHAGAYLTSSYSSDTGPTAPLKVECAGDGSVYVGAREVRSGGEGLYGTLSGGQVYPLVPPEGSRPKGKSQFKRINELFNEE
jgi:hypothetical protein